METLSFILSLIGAFGFGALLTNIIDRILNYRLQKKKFQFEKLYIKRAEVVEETYKKIIDTHRALESLMAPMQLAGEPTKAEKIKSAVDKGNDFVRYFDIHRIYFDENLEQEIEQLHKKMRDAFNKFKYATTEELGKQDIKEWTNAWQEIREETPKLRKEIEKKFRNIIGIKGSLWDKIKQGNQKIIK